MFFNKITGNTVGAGGTPPWDTALVLVCFLLILCLAAAFRVPRLTLRPVHGDEANQAVKTGILFDTGEYRYDPHEHHGPTLYYLTLPVLYFCGVSSFEDSTITQYRFVPVFFGMLVIGFLWLLRDALGTGAMLWTALFMAVSLPMTYYSRYYIQEVLLVCFVQAAFVSGWRYLKKPGPGWAIVLGVSLGLIHATKETSAVIAFSALIAVVLTLFFTRLRDGLPLGEQLREIFTPKTMRHLGITAGVALLVSVAFFSSFFTHVRGPLDSLLTYAAYITRAEGTGSSAIHDKPWYYYLVLLSYVYRQVGPRWSEAPMLAAALAGCFAVVWAKRPHAAGPALLFQRFLLFYTVVILVVYSLIPYKTPWNLLIFYHGLILVGGMGMAAFVRAARRRSLRTVLFVAGLGAAAFLARQSYFGNYVYYADARNPYVYAHPSKAVERIAERIDDIAAIAGKGPGLRINIIRPDGDYWPLPWYLRAYTRVGWWREIPETVDAEIILAAPELYGTLKERLHQDYLVEFHALRPGVLLHAYIRRDLWDAFLKTRE